MRRGVPPVAAVRPGGRSSSATTRSSRCRAPAASVASDLDPGEQRRQLRLVPGVTGGRQDRHDRPCPSMAGDVPGPRYGGVRGRRHDGEGLIPITPFPGPPQCAGGPRTWRSRPTPPVHFPGAQLPPGPWRYRTESTPAAPPWAPEATNNGPIPIRRRRSARRDLPVLGTRPAQQTCRNPDPAAGMSRQIAAAQICTPGPGTGASPSDTSACWVAPRRAGGRQSPTGSGSLDATPLFGLTIQPAGASLDLVEDWPESG